ncbi:MAG: leucine-rich repeat domain-containing protein [Eubacterium sp.]
MKIKNGITLILTTCIIVMISGCSTSNNTSVEQHGNESQSINESSHYEEDNAQILNLNISDKDLNIDDNTKTLIEYTGDKLIDIMAATELSGSSDTLEVYCDQWAAYKVTLPEGIKIIGEDSLGKYINMISITIPDSVEKIDDSAFESIPNLEEIDMGSSVTYIGEAAFYCAKNLKSIKFPPNLEEIGIQAFAMTAIEKLTFPDSLKNIGGTAFEGCESLKEVIFPANLEKIGPSAFKNCICIKSIEIPESTSEIAHEAFYNCYNIKDVTIYSSNVEIASDAFDGCSKDLTFHAVKGSTAEAYAKENGYSFEELKE